MDPVVLVVVVVDTCVRRAVAGFVTFRREHGNKTNFSREEQPVGGFMTSVLVDLDLLAWSFSPPTVKPKSSPTAYS